MGNSSEPPSPQSTKINQRQACLNADLFFCALQRPAAGGEGCRSAFGATKSRREGFLQALRDVGKRPKSRRGRTSSKAVSFKSFARTHAASGQGKDTRRVAKHSTPELVWRWLLQTQPERVTRICESTLLGKDTPSTRIILSPEWMKRPAFICSP